MFNLDKFWLLVLLKLCWYFGFVSEVIKRPVVVFMRKEVEAEMLFSEPNAQLGKV